MNWLTDSPYRCPRCGKRLMQDMGPNENTGVTEIFHECWECDDRWSEADLAPLRRRRAPRAEMRLA